MKAKITIVTAERDGTFVMVLYGNNTTSVAAYIDKSKAALRERLNDALEIFKSTGMEVKLVGLITEENLQALIVI